MNRESQGDGFPSTVKLLVIGCVVLAIVSVIGFFSLESSKVAAEKEKVLTEIEQREETERTEEGAQFWQKLVPWGSYEEENGGE